VRSNERQQPITAAANSDEVRPHLLTRCGLKPSHWIRLRTFERCQIYLELTDAAGKAGLMNLSQQHCYRNPVRSGLLYARLQLHLERIELARSRRTRAVLSSSAVSQVSAHDVMR